MRFPILRAKKEEIVLKPGESNDFRPCLIELFNAMGYDRFANFALAAIEVYLSDLLPEVLKEDSQEEGQVNEKEKLALIDFSKTDDEWHEAYVSRIRAAYLMLAEELRNQPK